MRLIVTSMALLLGAGAALAQRATPTPAPDASAAPTAPGKAVRAKKSAIEDSKAECIGMWDAGTHMTKQEWANTCTRIQTRLENLRVEDLDVGTGARRKPRGKQGSIDAKTRVN
jgi:hypothetical protein